MTLRTTPAMAAGVTTKLWEIEDLLALLDQSIYIRLILMALEPDLETLRERIDQIDKELVELLAERFAITNQIGQYKRAQNLSPVDEQREKAQLQRIKELAVRGGLNPDFAERFLRCVIDEVVQNHKKIGQ